MEPHRLSDGSTFSVPSDAIPAIKQILLNIKEKQLQPEDQRGDLWNAYGHRIGNAAGSLMKSALMGDQPEEQETVLQTQARDLIKLKGKSIIPLLQQIGYPDVHIK